MKYRLGNLPKGAFDTQKHPTYKGFVPRYDPNDASYDASHPLKEHRRYKPPYNSIDSIYSLESKQTERARVLIK